jgi:uncharacterized membrane protein YheB (UPF0754 family)
VLKDITIPVFTGIIGYVTNWTGIWMLFNPLEFKGFKLPGLAYLAKLMPRKLQQVPGVMHGGVGWQGIIPSRAAKMGSISVDKTIAKIGSAEDFYDSLDPDALADHILATSSSDMEALVEDAIREQQPQLWQDLPPAAREAIRRRIREQMPEIVREVVVERIADNIDHLLDVKLMVIRHLEARPELANRMFREVGEKELRFIINFGFFFGFACGIPTVFITHLIPLWWVLPVLGTMIGWVTNWLAIAMIFEPNEPRRFLGRTWQGLFLKRREHAAEVYAGIVADEIITVSNLGDELMSGPSSDRTRHLIASALRPAIDRASGQLQPLVRVAVGTREYDAIREEIATGGVDYTLTPLQDETFNREQAQKLRGLMVERMRDLSNPDFAEMLRSGMREDEWLLILHGAVLGFGAGLLHLALFGV